MPSRNVFVLAVLAILGLVLSVGVVVAKQEPDAPDRLPARMQNSKYVALTLASGQMYFGLLRSPRDGFYEVDKAHFVGQGNRVQPVTEQGHGPSGTIFVPIQNVALVQPLAPDSDVVQAIDRKPFKSHGRAYGVSQGSIESPPDMSGNGK